MKWLASLALFLSAPAFAQAAPYKLVIVWYQSNLTLVDYLSNRSARCLAAGESSAAGRKADYGFCLRRTISAVSEAGRKWMTQRPASLGTSAIAHMKSLCQYRCVPLLSASAPP